MPEPDDGFQALTSAVGSAFGYPSYNGALAEVVSHMPIGAYCDPVACERLGVARCRSPAL